MTTPTWPPAPDAAFETVQLRSEADLLTAVPFLLGFHPDPGSIVVIALHQTGIAVTIRMDLPAPGSNPDDGWTKLLGPLLEVEAQALAVIGYVSPDDLGFLLALAATAPLPVFSLLRVEGDRWWSLDHPESLDGPGQPTTPDTTMAAELLTTIGAPATSRADLAACLQPGPRPLLDDVAQHLPIDPKPGPADLRRALQRAHDKAADGPQALAPDQAALLLQALRHTAVRDTCVGWRDDAAMWLWTDLLHNAPPGWIAPPAAMLAVTAYQRGNAVLATLAAEHALTDSPGYGLACMVLAMTHALIPPDKFRDAIDHAVQEVTRQHPDLTQDPTTADHPRHDPEEGDTDA